MDAPSSVTRIACRLRCTGQPSPAVADTIAGQFGATREQTVGAIGAARGTLCTRAPG